MPERLPPNPPRTRLPAGSCDCHMHAYSDRYPATPDSPFRPVSGGDIETYTELRRLPCAVGIDHNGKFLEPVGLGHPGFRALCDLFADWCGSDEVMTRILVTNPETVYGLPERAS